MAALLVLTISTVGCGGGGTAPLESPITGTWSVTFQPLTNGEVTCWIVKGQGPDLADLVVMKGSMTLEGRGSGQFEGQLQMYSASTPGIACYDQNDVPVVYMGDLPSVISDGRLIGNAVTFTLDWNLEVESSSVGLQPYQLAGTLDEDQRTLGGTVTALVGYVGSGPTVTGVWSATR